MFTPLCLLFMLLLLISCYCLSHHLSADDETGNVLKSTEKCLLKFWAFALHKNSEDAIKQLPFYKIQYCFHFDVCRIEKNLIITMLFFSLIGWELAY